MTPGLHTRTPTQTCIHLLDEIYFVSMWLILIYLKFIHKYANLINIKHQDFHICFLFCGINATYDSTKNLKFNNFMQLFLTNFD